MLMYTRKSLKEKFDQEQVKLSKLLKRWQQWKSTLIFFVSLEGPGCYNHTKYSKITELHGYFITL